MSFEIIAGDFPQGSALIENKDMWGKTTTLELRWGTKAILFVSNSNQVLLSGHVERVELVTEENKKSFVGSAGWGLVGAAALGPLGLIAGALAGGNKKEICFSCYLKDGRKFMAIADNKSYQMVASLGFKDSTTNEKHLTKSVCIHCEKTVEADWKTCPFCSKPLKCRKCGSSIKQDWKFCASCSNPL